MIQSDYNKRLKKLAVIASVCLAVLLSVFKFFAFLRTDSLAIFSSFVDSLTDLFASVISFIAIYFSTKPATSSHRYGYGKTEALSALLQAMFVGSSGIFVIYDSIQRLINPVLITDIPMGITTMILSVCATLFLVLFQTFVARKTNSLAIKADRAHYTVDFLTNAAVICSLILVYFFDFIYFDIIAALFISAYLLYSAYSLAKEAVELITDKELPAEIREKVTDIVEKSKGILGLHDFRTRSLGDIYYFELHLEIDGKISLLEAHKIASTVEQRILKVYPNSQILIHQDPYGIRETRLDHEIQGSCDIQ